jgi:hypothetical protein
LSAVAEGFMLSVEIEFEPLEPLEDAIVIRSWCEGESIFDERLAIFDWGIEFPRLLNSEKKSAF